MRRGRVRESLRAGLVGVVLLGCGETPGVTGESEGPLLVGRIALVGTGSLAPVDLRIDRIEEPRPVYASGPAVILAVPSGTLIRVRRPDGSLRRGSTADLVVGARVRARYYDIVLLSDPPRYTATRIEVQPAVAGVETTPGRPLARATVGSAGR